MISRVHSFILQGIDAAACEIEVDISPCGLPKTTVVGLPDAAVKESSDRVRTALLNSGFVFPRRRITVNLAPADVRKEGPVYDLPIAVSLLMASQTISPAADNGALQAHEFLLAGELALDGRVRPVKGVISMALLVKQLGLRGVIVPAHNAPEAAAVDGIEVIGVESLGQVVGMFNGKARVDLHPTIEVESLIERIEPKVDFVEVRGQEAAKRALTVAAAGAHNLLMIGPAGTGETVSLTETEDNVTTALGHIAMTQLRPPERPNHALTAETQ